MKISVVIPAFNEEKLIAASLASVRDAMASFTARGWESELIVCDNNSTDRTGELARAAGATVVFEPVNQIGRARNQGAAAATGDWLIFVDADSHPSPGLFADAASAINSGKIVFGGSTVRMERNHPVAVWVTRLWNVVSRTMNYAAGAFIFCEAAAFRTIGGFDDEFFAGEELILSRKLKKLARATGRRAVILHHHPILTSDRKVRLYSPRELLRLLFWSIFSPRRTMRNRATCHAWYDGRR